MNKLMQNNVRMAEAVYDVLDKYKEIWSQSKGFSKEVDESRNLMKQMEESRVQALGKSKGATKAKAELRKRSTTMCIELANRASVFAGKQKNVEALVKLYVTKTKLNGMSANTLMDKLKSVHEQLTTLGPELEMYDVTKAHIEEFSGLITKYRILIPKPRVLQVANKNSNRKSAEIMKQVKATFENMDKLLSNFKDKNFISEYNSARMTIKLGSRHDKKEDTDKDGKDETMKNDSKEQG